ncbi:MAG: hypothetical protein COA96_05500 [SAR86 cluster bacterium]|uniref:Thioredoxin domain-containing protein n=1 Tax=SAR86 cluster bacterium TaxID=2030880 RepID=A0A2A5B5Y2_9GAMM|nr:MAG: hypothetical protein COA96_05500 [SAR86 cluster bacterium]
MNKPLVIILSAVAVYFIFFNGDTTLKNMPPVVSDATSVREKNYEVDDLYDSRTSFKDLAELGSYTIVEVYTDICLVCKKLETKFPSLLRQREDFVIRRVRLHAGPISFSTTEEMQEWRARQDSMQEFYNYYGTPHIEIYDASGNTIAKDYGSDKSGFNTLKSWLDWQA